MAVSRNSSTMFVAQDKPLDLNYLISNFKLQYEGYCKEMGFPSENNISFELILEFYHFRNIIKITLGDEGIFFPGRLNNFFGEHGVQPFFTLGPNAMYIHKEELDNAKITYRHAHDFLFKLSEHIKSEVKWYKETTKECEEIEAQKNRPALK